MPRPHRRGGPLAGGLRLLPPSPRTRPSSSPPRGATRAPSSDPPGPAQVDVCEARPATGGTPRGRAGRSPPEPRLRIVCPWVAGSTDAATDCPDNTCAIAGTDAVRGVNCGDNLGSRNRGASDLGPASRTASDPGPSASPARTPPRPPDRAPRGHQPRQRHDPTTPQASGPRPRRTVSPASPPATPWTAPAVALGLSVAPAARAGERPAETGQKTSSGRFGTTPRKPRRCWPGSPEIEGGSVRSPCRGSDGARPGRGGRSSSRGRGGGTGGRKHQRGSPQCPPSPSRYFPDFPEFRSRRRSQYPSAVVFGTFPGTPRPPVKRPGSPLGPRPRLAIHSPKFGAAGCSCSMTWGDWPEHLSPRLSSGPPMLKTPSLPRREVRVTGRGEYREANARMRALADLHGLRLHRLEDGEEVIACRRGFICEWDPPGRLAWCVLYPATASPSAKLQGMASRDAILRMEREGDEEFLASFDVGDLPGVAERWAQARRRRKMTPEQREAAAARLRAFRFAPSTHVRVGRRFCFASDPGGEAQGSGSPPPSDPSPAKGALCRGPRKTAGGSR